MHAHHLRRRARGRAQGFARVAPVVGELAAVQSTEAWDGRDGVAVEEDEFSLADIMADEL